jgi:hypothetical protein
MEVSAIIVLMATLFLIAVFIYLEMKGDDEE